MNRIIRNIVMFILGFCFYVGLEICFRNRSHILMGVCGGFILCVAGEINDKFSWKIDLLLQCAIISFFITVIEAILGNIDYYFLHQNIWDNSNLKYSYLNGKVSLLFSIIWFFMELVVVFVHDAITYYWLHEGNQPEYWIFGKRIWQMPVRKCENKGE